MPHKFLLPEDFEGKTGNVYEAVMVVARRARKIAADQKVEIEKSMHQIEVTEEQEAVPPPLDDSNNVYLKLDKPTRIAFDELFHQELEYEYREKTPGS